jgi:hypothetical protein
MWKLFVALAAVWLGLMPPLFTAGACTAQFDEESARVQHEARSWRNSAQALAYWQARGVPVRSWSLDQCRAAKPRFLAHCGAGPLVYARVPVTNPICKWYRDDEIKVQLQFDERERLLRIATDMSPFKSLPIPLTKTSIDWAR